MIQNVDDSDYWVFLGLFIWHLPDYTFASTCKYTCTYSHKHICISFLDRFWRRVRKWMSWTTVVSAHRPPPSMQVTLEGTATFYRCQTLVSGFWREVSVSIHRQYLRIMLWKCCKLHLLVVVSASIYLSQLVI